MSNGAFCGGHATQVPSGNWQKVTQEEFIQILSEERCAITLPIYEPMIIGNDCLEVHCALERGHEGQHEYHGQSNPNGEDNHEYIVRW